jgi:hypothetical protein
MSFYPSCPQDGCFLLEFFICHPSDSRINAVNQRYWLQLHTLGKLQSPLNLTETHLIKPPDTLVDYAQRHKLRPFCKWINLTHLNMFIHGPFEFASIHGWKTQDCVSQVNWDVLKSHLDMTTTPFRNSMSHLIPSTLTAVRTNNFMMPPYLVNSFLGHHRILIHQVCLQTNDKKSLFSWLPPIFIFVFIHL